MFRKIIHGSSTPFEITWTVKLAKKDDGTFRMVKVAHTSDLKEEELEDIENLIEKYSNTGVIEEMKRRPDTFLWVKARAIDADVPNENGDYFSKEELLKKVDAGKKGKIFAYKTFEGVPIYTNHKNDDIEEAKGKVVYAEWDEKENCVYCTFFIDTEAYPKLARGIREGYIKDVSMGASVDYSKCSICDNYAETEKQFCDHIKNHKGRTFTGVVDKGPNKGKSVKEEKVFEKNFNVKFIELSCVSDGAFENCEIDGILPSEKMIKAVSENVIKEANNIEKNIKNALNEKISENDDVRNLLVDTLNLSENIKLIATISQDRVKKEAQIFPTSPREFGAKSPADEINPLVGNIEQGTKNEVINEPQQVNYSNIQSPGVGVNTLDALKDVIKNINTVIVTLLGTKGINLEHVRDLSKSVADIQDTIEDMIDSGSIDISGSIPITPNIPQAQINPQTINAAAPKYEVPPEGVGLQVGASNKALFKLSKLKEKLEKINNRISNMHPSKEEINIMSNFRKLAYTLREKNTSEKREKYEQEKNGFKVSIASNGEISAFYRDVPVEWEPEVSEDLIEKIEDGNITEATSDLLTQFSTSFSDSRKIRRLASNNGTEKALEEEEAIWPNGRLGNPGYPLESYIENVRKGTSPNREDSLEEVRKGEETETQENQLSNRNVSEGKLGRSSVDERTKEEQLNEVRSASSAYKIVTSINNCLANAVCESMVSPEEVVESAIKIASNADFVKSIIKEYSSQEHIKARETERNRNKFYGKVASKQGLSVDSYVIASLSDAISSEINEGDLLQGLVEIKNQDFNKYASLIGQIAKERLLNAGASTNHISVFEPDEEKRNEIKKQFIMAMVNNSDSNEYSRESIKNVISAFAKSIIDTDSSADEAIESFASRDRKEIFAEIEIAKENIDKIKKIQSRKAYWKTASSSDIFESIISNVAEKANKENISTNSLVDTIDLLLSKKASTLKAIKVAMDKISGNITDRSEREFTINFSLEDCGCDKDDPDIESKIKEYIVNLFQEKGYQLAGPETLSFTSLDIREDGTVYGVIKSTVTRNFSTEDVKGVSEMQPEIMEERVIEARRKEREALVKAAQAMGATQNVGITGNPGADPAAGAVGADPGISAITGGGEPGMSDEDGDDMALEDSISTPGEIAPPGSFCPACASKDVDLADGHGKCNDCGVEFDISMQIQIVNPEVFSGKEVEQTEDTEIDFGEELPQADVNQAVAQPGQAQAGVPPMGGATAPPMGGGVTPSMPMAKSNIAKLIKQSSDIPQLVRISWISEPDLFLKTAYSHKTGNMVGQLSPGHNCPSCGEKDKIVRTSSSDKTNVYCDSCGNVSVVDIELVGKDKIRNTITWII